MTFVLGTALEIVRRIGDVEEIWYTSSGGARVQGWLVKPVDFDGLLALFHPGVEWVEAPGVPCAITRRGHAEVKRYFESMPRDWEELRIEPERFVDYDDEVLALARVTTRARRGGPEIDRPFDAIFTVRDGMADALTTTLAKLPELRVVANRSAAATPSSGRTPPGSPTDGRRWSTPRPRGTA